MLIEPAGGSDERGYASSPRGGHLEIAAFNLLAGWIGMFGGVVSGAIIGLFFHHDTWMGGYDSFRRRMTRLGHISFFGLGFVNVLYGLTIRAVEIPVAEARLASWGLVIGLVSMPICCFLTAWRKPFRHLFPIPVVSVGAGIVALLLGWPAR